MSIKKKSYYKPIAGRRKSKEGTKRLQTKYESSRQFEYETIEYWQDLLWLHDIKGVAFRRPVSQSPADVWCIGKHPDGLIRLNLTQCKSSLDTNPPKKNKEEEEKFIAYCTKLGAFCFWGSRWKKNKNKYIRQMEIYNYGRGRWDIINSDFTDRLKRFKTKK